MPGSWRHASPASPAKRIDLGRESGPPSVILNHCLESTTTTPHVPKRPLGLVAPNAPSHLADHGECAQKPPSLRPAAALRAGDYRKCSQPTPAFAARDSRLVGADMDPYGI